MISPPRPRLFAGDELRALRPASKRGHACRATAAIATPIACWRPAISISSSRAASSPTTSSALIPIIEGAGGVITTWDGGQPPKAAASSRRRRPPRPRAALELLDDGLARLAEPSSSVPACRSRTHRRPPRTGRGSVPLHQHLVPGPRHHDGAPAVSRAANCSMACVDTTGIRAAAIISVGSRIRREERSAKRGHMPQRPKLPSATVGAPIELRAAALRHRSWV